MHEAVRVDGPTARLRSEIHHYSYRSVQEHHRRIVRYAALGAADLSASGRRAGWIDLAFRPWWAWFRQFVLLGGFLDGKAGYMAARSTAHSVFLRYAILRERQRRSGASDGR